jgi:hypothetical protein
MSSSCRIALLRTAMPLAFVPIPSSNSTNLIGFGCFPKVTNIPRRAKKNRAFRIVGISYCREYSRFVFLATFAIARILFGLLHVRTVAVGRCRGGYAYCFDKLACLKGDVDGQE